MKKIKVYISILFILSILIIGSGKFLNVYASSVCLHSNTDKITTNTHSTEYSNSVTSYCYYNYEITTTTCKVCGAVSTNKVCTSSIPHSWSERIYTYDNTYLYYKNVCSSCSCSYNTRKVPHNGIVPWSILIN